MNWNRKPEEYRNTRASEYVPVTIIQPGYRGRYVEDPETGNFIFIPS